MWDRWALAAFGGFVALGSLRMGWRLGRGGDWLAAAGGFVLALVALSMPLLLIALGPGTGR